MKVSPIYDKLSTSNPEVAFGKVDVDDNNESAAEHQVSSEILLIGSSK